MAESAWLGLMPGPTTGKLRSFHRDSPDAWLNRDPVSLYSLCAFHALESNRKLQYTTGAR